MTKSNKTSKKSNNWGAPAPGTRYNPPPAEKAQHRSEAIADSAWADRKGNNTITSAQPSVKYPGEATSSDNSYAKSLLASDTSNQVDRSGKFFK